MEHLAVFLIAQTPGQQRTPPMEPRPDIPDGAAQRARRIRVAQFLQVTQHDHLAVLIGRFSSAQRRAVV